MALVGVVAQHGRTTAHLH